MRAEEQTRILPAAILARVAAENVRRFRIALGGRPTLRGSVEFRPSIAVIARSRWSRSNLNSVTSLLVFMMAPLGQSWYQYSCESHNCHVTGKNLSGYTALMQADMFGFGSPVLRRL